MTPNEIEAAAEALFQAEEARKQIGLLTTAHPEMTLEMAYAVQAALIAKKEAKGARRIGWKIGLTSRAMQEALQITTPDSGVLFEDMRFETGAEVPFGHFIAPRIEAEIAFVMKAPLKGRHITRADVLAATDYVAPALEILDTRILRKDPLTGALRKVQDTISDNAANAGIVLGKERFGVEAVDLRWIGAIVARDGVVEETGLGAGVLNDPVTGILWLVHRLAEYGAGVEAGEVLLSGSFIRPIEAPPGASFSADFGTFGAVDIHFGAKP